jgi:hypothetical protein
MACVPPVMPDAPALRVKDRPAAIRVFLAEGWAKNTEALRPGAKLGQRANNPQMRRFSGILEMYP